MDAASRDSVAAVQRQFHGHPRALGRGVFGGYGPPVSLDQGFGNRQPEPKSACGTGSGRVSSIESLKYMRQVLGTDADAVVLEGNSRWASVFTGYSYLHHPAFRAVAHGIFQQIEPYQLQVLWIGPKKHLAIGGKINTGMAGLRQIADSLHSFFAGRGDIDELKVPPKVPVSPVFIASQTQYP